MNRSELIDYIEVYGVTRGQKKTIVDDALRVISDSLRAGEPVELKGFGTFSVIETQGRPGRNVRTGEAITIPAGRKVKFKASSGLLPLPRAASPGGFASLRVSRPSERELYI